MHEGSADTRGKAKRRPGGACRRCPAVPPGGTLRNRIDMEQIRTLTP